MMSNRMHIKLVPKADPDATGHWITVPLRTTKFNKFNYLTELYALDIPEDHFPVSFTRFDDIKERLP